MKSLEINKKLPEFVRPFFWSYDWKILDLEIHKALIITQILNFGDKKSTDWLRKNYSKETIKKILEKPTVGLWNKKSLYFWCFLFNVPFKFSTSRI